MNVFDVSVLHFLNSVSHKSVLFDSLMNFLVWDNFFKGGIVMAALWFLWFHKSSETTNNRKGIIITFISSLVAIIVGRGLELTLPFRIRPAYNPDIFFIRPYRFENFSIGDTSSFPSDHAVLFFALATGIFLISKKGGILAYLYVFFMICLPRVYLGLHYPTDILAGAVIGVTITLIVSVSRIFVRITSKTLQFSSDYPGYFYALFFLLSLQISTLFEEMRTIGGYLYQFLHK